MSNKYYYAVREGRTAGVYSSWDDCKAQVNGFSGAKYKKFTTIEEAQSFVQGQIGGGGGNSSSLKPNATITSIATSSSTAASSATAATSAASASRGRKAAPSRVTLSATPSSGSRTHHHPYSRPAASSKSRRAGTSISSAGEADHVVYTDGASQGNGTKHARAGYGVYWGPNHPNNVSEPLPRTDRQTNQRAELQAIITALEQTRRTDKSLEIRTDSSYSIKALTEWHHNWEKNNWKSSNGKPVQNRDLIEIALKFMKDRTGEVRFTHVAGHAGIEGNERADQLAVLGAQKP